MTIKLLLTYMLWGRSPLKEGYEYCGCCEGEGRNYSASGTSSTSAACDRCGATGQVKKEKS